MKIEIQVRQLYEDAIDEYKQSLAAFIETVETHQPFSEVSKANQVCEAQDARIKILGEILEIK